MLSRLLLVAGLFAAPLTAQVYSPKVFLKGQVDSTDLHTLAQGIFAQAHATTPREKAEAIWRFFLTDGRFVRPGIWYHIAGWSYEEPKGEVLDPLKLLNSYGFGLCYQIAPLLEAVYDAAGFEDARVWFLTNHTVAEVFYEGAYHYFDSDLMGYNTIGKGKPKALPVAGVQDIAANANIILDHLDGNQSKGAVDNPWYPGDVADGAMRDIASYFTTTHDNWLFPFTRYPQGHSMDFTLRPGERMIRYFGAEEGLFYLPYKVDEKGAWQENPEQVLMYNIHTQDGPISRRDNRGWGTGRFEYHPVLSDAKAYYHTANLRLPDASHTPPAMARQEPGKPAIAIFEVESPYVFINAEFSMDVNLAEGGELTLETSTDHGISWDTGGSLKGPHQGAWKATPKIVARTLHGALNAVAGKYQYLLRLTLNGSGAAGDIQNVFLLSRFEMNPRILPALAKGRNELVYQPGPQHRRWTFPVRLDEADKAAFQFTNARYVAELSQGMLQPQPQKTAEILFELSAPDESPLTGFDAGGRFLDLRDQLAPDKRTAEVRGTELGLAKSDNEVSASLEWSVSPAGPYTALWKYNPAPQWKDGKPFQQLLRWPEVDRQVRNIPAGTRKIYVRYQLTNIALDDIRLAALAEPAVTSPALEVIHVWFENDKEHSHVEHIANLREEHPYTVALQPSGKLKNYAVIYNCPAPEHAAVP